jgi:hypothetical protein
MDNKDIKKEIAKIDDILKDETSLYLYLRTLPPRLSFMSSEKRIENVLNNLIYKRHSLQRRLDGIE